MSIASDVTADDDPESSYTAAPRSGDVARFAAAVPFYLAFARKVGGPVLALGQETNPVTVPLVQAGFEVTCLVPLAGHDVANAAAHVRDIATAAGVSRIDADPCRFGLDTLFRLVIVPERALRRLHNSTDRRAMLGRIRRQLARGGRVVLDLARHTPDSSPSVDEEAVLELLEHTGFDVTARYGDAEFRPVTSASTTILLVCKGSASAVSTGGGVMSS